MSDSLKQPRPSDIKNTTPEAIDLKGYVRKKVATILQSDGGFVDFADINRLGDLILTQSDRLQSERLYAECMPELTALAEEVKIKQTTANETARTQKIQSLEEEMQDK